MTLSSRIDTDRFSQVLRKKAVDVASRKLLVTNFFGTTQEQDLSVPPNCEGFGRIRHFRRTKEIGWPSNPLPIDPAARALGVSRVDEIEAQAFQNSACNWRCWYCFVPFDLLSANPKHSAWLSAEELVDLYLREPSRAPVIDLTGGQPDLVPEWVLWTMEALRSRDLEKKVFLWSDDNLSNDFYFRFLSEADRETIARYPMYSRVCCFKGFDAESFAFNTSASEDLFDRQFLQFERLLADGLDLYAYATFTCANTGSVEREMPKFIDRLQTISETLPLRTVLLKIELFTPVETRLTPSHRAALQNQLAACEMWLSELQRRFSASQLEAAQTDIVGVEL